VKPRKGEIKGLNITISHVVSSFESIDNRVAHADSFPFFTLNETLIKARVEVGEKVHQVYYSSISNNHTRNYTFHCNNMSTKRGCFEHK